MTFSVKKIAGATNEAYCIGSFSAMASPCEVLVDTTDLELARKITASVQAEASQIEQKFSR